MTEREIFLASVLIFAVLFFSVTLFIIGQLPLVLAATAAVELILRRIERRRAEPPAPHVAER